MLIECENCKQPFQPKLGYETRRFCYEKACSVLHMIAIRKPRKKGKAKLMVESKVEKKVKEVSVAESADPWKQFVTIKIPRLSSQDRPYHFVCVNGRTFQIKKDVDVRVPLPVMNALKDAVETRYELIEKSIGGILVPEMQPYEQQRIPFQIVREG